jgi:hypothetical protein
VGIVVSVLLSLVILPAIPSIQAQNTTSFLPTDNFSIPQLGGSINFAVNGSYRSAVLENNTWVFRGLALNSSQTRGTLYISVENSNVTITDFRTNFGLGRSQYIRYTVEGQGVQRINLGINQTTNVADWMVTLNRQFLNEGEGWQLRRGTTIVVSGQIGNVTVVHYNWDIVNDSNLPFHEQHSVALTVVAVLIGTVLAATISSIKVRRR